MKKFLIAFGILLTGTAFAGGYIAMPQDQPIIKRTIKKQHKTRYRYFTNYFVCVEGRNYDGIFIRNNPARYPRLGRRNFCNLNNLK